MNHSCEYRKLIERLCQNFERHSAWNAGDRTTSPDDIYHEDLEIVLDGKALLQNESPKP